MLQSLHASTLCKALVATPPAASARDAGRTVQPHAECAATPRNNNNNTINLQRNTTSAVTLSLEPFASAASIKTCAAVFTFASGGGLLVRCSRTMSTAS